MLCNCNLTNADEFHDHLNCGLCKPRLEEGEKVTNCIDETCKRRMLVEEGKEIVRCACGRMYLQDLVTGVLTRIPRAVWFSSPNHRSKDREIEEVARQHGK